MRSFVLALCAMGATAATLESQQWNSEAVRSLVAAATVRRNALLGTGGLRDYSARAHGFVFFMAQVGEGFPEPPRVVKADQLELEVYWKSPNRSKQRIIGWRDRVELPTDIQYHRDHLGIVQNNFGDSIRLGDGTEARDVVHPLSPAGPASYDYAIVDSLTITMPGRSVRVYEVMVRPRDTASPGVLGSIFLERADASVVRFRFTFTSSAYLDSDLEDITIVLDNGLQDGRFWLPRRQEIEIRRRSSTFGIPLRGIIHASWELDQYLLNVGLTDSLFGGQEIVAAPVATRDSFPWPASLVDALVASGNPELITGIEDVRAEVARAAGGLLPTGLPRSQFAAASVSDLIRFNRVEGLSLGLGRTSRGAGFDVSTTLRYSFAAGRLQGRGRFTRRIGRYAIHVTGQSAVNDIGDEPVVSGVLGSLLAQEAGRDLGDYVLLENLGIGISWRKVRLGLRAERAGGLTVRAVPITGTFRDNQFLASDWAPVVSLELESQSVDYAKGRDAAARFRIEGGEGDGSVYARIRGDWGAAARIGSTDLRFSGWLGFARGGLPAYRTFVLGGWGTLPGEPFRRWGGRRAAFASLEWGVRLSLPELPLGRLASAGASVYLAPFVSGGWTDDPPAGYTWQATGDPRLVTGLAIEPFGGLLRLVVARNLSEGSFGLTVDITKTLWGVL